MKYAVISDVHGNFCALRATIYSAINNGCNAFIFLGDYGTDFVEMHSILDLIRWCQNNYQTFIIKGNREDYILDYLDDKHPDWEDDPTKKVILKGIQTLTKEDIEFIRNLSNCKIVNLDGIGKVILSHSLILNNKYRDLIKSNEVKTLLFGHSHSSGNWFSSGCNIYNPGSAGLSDDGVSCTYGILENVNGNNIFTIEAISYDISMEEKIIDSIPEISGVEAAYWGELLKMSMHLGKQLTVDFIQECARLNALKEESIKNNTTPDLSPLKDYNLVFYQLKSASADHNGIFLPFADFDIRKKYKLTNKTIYVPNNSKCHYEIFEKKFGKFSKEIIEAAFSNFQFYYEQAMKKKKNLIT